MNAFMKNANPVTALPHELPTITLGIANAMAAEFRKLGYSDSDEARRQRDKLRGFLLAAGWKLDTTGHAVEA